MAWHATALVTVLLVPSITWMGQPFWMLPATDMLQFWVWGTTYLVFVTWLHLMQGRSVRLAWVVTAIAAAVCWGGGYAVLALAPDAALSRGVAAITLGLGVTLGVTPLTLHRRAALVVTVTVIAGAIAMTGRAIVAESEESAFEWITIPTAHHLVSVGIQRDVAPTPRPGGAITPFGEGFLLATAQGTFHVLRWSNARDRLLVSRLPVPSPLNHGEFAADFAEVADDEEPPFFRVTDIMLEPASATPRLYVAHQYWNSAERCLTMRVSSVVLDTASGSATPWTTEFESRPCLAMKGGFTHNETGGQLAWREGRLLLAIGDHGFSRDGAIAQDTAAHYGKILELDLPGRAGVTRAPGTQATASIVSLGHRNPQGLLVARDGRIWSTEHGPQGGDEINMITRGGNYGWPWRTYGTQYGLRYWPGDSAGRNHGMFREPAHAFVPSLGISAVIEVQQGPLSQWRGDLLIGSLGGRALYRARVRDDQVIYLERIEVKRRVRDIAQSKDGRIVVWTDAGHLLVLSESAKLPGGEVIYAARCAGCHGSNLEGTAIGPSLRATVGRQIGRSSGYRYSAALRAVPGAWSRDLLDAFLRDPQRFARGTTMQFDGVANDAERRELVEFLFNNY